MKAKRGGIGRWRRLAATPVGVGLAAIALLASALLGLRIPVLGFQEGLPSAAPLDYSGALPGELAPLQDRYVEGILGKPTSETLRSGSLAGVASRGRSGLSKRLSVAHALTNDEFENAYAVSSLPFTARTSTVEASRASQEPASCGGDGGTAWYRYTPATNQSLAANTFGSDYTTTLNVFVGDKVGRLRSIGCSSPGTSNAQVGFLAKARDTYFFQITGSGGHLVFTLDPAGETTRVSLSSEDVQADGHAFVPSVSADGRFVAFQSDAPTFPGYRPCPTNPVGDYCMHAYVRDRLRGITEIVDVSTLGETGNDKAAAPIISANGRFVAFNSYATNLVEGDTNGESDVFVRDLAKKKTTRVSVSSSGEQAESDETYPANQFSTYTDPVHRTLVPSTYGEPLNGFVSISADGRYVAFDSLAGNLVPGDTNSCDHYAWAYDGTVTGAYLETPTGTHYNCRDVFVHDLVTRTTTRVSVSSAGEQGNADSFASSVSPDGGVVVFSSLADNLAPGDPDECFDWDNQPTTCVDVFAHDRLTGATEVVSVSSTGEWGDRHSQLGWGPSASADNRYIVFQSWSANLDGGKSPSEDLFVRDRVEKTTTMISESEEGAPLECRNDPEALCFVTSSSISADGRYVAFLSDADNLLLGDTNNVRDVFVKDRLTGATVRASVSSSGAQANALSYSGIISQDGRYIVFSSPATNLVSEDSNGVDDIFIYEQPADR
jgi:Tol biopolymer transport system component